MKLKGEWDSGTKYDVGDVALYPNGNFYQMVRPGKAGVPCADALYWNILPSPLQECARMIMDGIGAAVEIAKTEIATNLSEDALSLKTETGEYVITVDDSGDTPELVVSEDDTATAVEGEGE